MISEESMVQLAKTIVAARQRGRELAPVRLGLCCETCEFWQYADADAEGDAPCEARDEETNRSSCCALYEDGDGERASDRAEDLADDWKSWRRR